MSIKLTQSLFLPLFLSLFLFLFVFFLPQFALLSTGSSAAAADSNIVLQFPQNYAVGKIYLLRSGYGGASVRNFIVSRAFPAQGTVRVRREQLLSLIGGYALTENMRALSKVPAQNFVHLDLRKLEIISRDLASISHFTALRQLELDNTEIDDNALQYLHRLSNLKNLNLSKTLITGRNFDQLSVLTQLETLDLGRLRLRSGSLAAIAKLKSIKTLLLDECNLSDKDLGSISVMNNIVFLSLKENKQISGPGLRQLERLQNLRVLFLQGDRLDAEGLAALSHCHLNKLVLRSGDLSNGQLVLAKKMMPAVVFEIEPVSHVPLSIFEPLHY